MTDDRLPCPIRDCPKLRRPEHAFCIAHWRAVAPTLKREVISCWNERRRTSAKLRRARRSEPDDVVAYLAKDAKTALKAHLQALENAQAWVEGRGPIDLFANVDARDQKRTPNA